MDMKEKKNGLSWSYIGSCIVCHLFWGGVFWFWNRVFLFRCLEGKTLLQSKLILLGMVLGGIALGLIIDLLYFKAAKNPFYNVIIGFGVYTALTYISLRRTLVIVSLMASLVLGILFTLKVMCRPIGDWSRKSRIIGKRIYRAMAGSKAIFGLGLGSICVILGLSVILQGYLIAPTVSPAKYSELMDWSVTNRIEDLVCLTDEDFAELDVEKKLDIAQIVANIEVARLGIPHELNVVASKPAEKKITVLGYYNEAQHLIVINDEYLLRCNAKNLLDTVCHECYHAFQYRMLEEFRFEENGEPAQLNFVSDIYSIEFEHYVSDDKLGYYTQPCEISASEYAQLETTRILSEIEEYTTAG